ncbi:MAG: DUF3592 domain-containing protein [Anaerolineales bacterium]
MEFLIFFGAAIILLSAAYIITTIMVKRKGQGVPNWPATDGAIIDQALYRHTRRTEAGEQTTYTPTIKYTYIVDQTTYHGHKHPTSGVSFPDRRSAETVLEHYSRGKVVTVHYNPNAPRQARLEVPRPTEHNAVILLGAAQLIVGVGAILLGVLWP